MRRKTTSTPTATSTPTSTPTADDRVAVPPELRPLLVPIDTVRPSPENPRTGHPVKLIAGLLEEFGWRAALTVRSDGRITAGEGRWLAAKRLGLTHVPVIRCDDDDKTAHRWMVAADRSSELTMWDAQEIRVFEPELEGLVDQMHLRDFLGPALAPLPPEPPTIPEGASEAADAHQGAPEPEASGRPRRSRSSARSAGSADGDADGGASLPEVSLFEVSWPGANADAEALLERLSSLGGGVVVRRL